MDRTASWEPCRLVPLDGKSQGRKVGPDGGCTSAAWSPDGRWMYFSAVVGGSQHLWRQAYPDGAPEQITFGATEEEGIAMAPDGRSLITSIGTSRSAVWIHDPAGERAISTEGYAYQGRLSRDGRRLFYLSRQNQRSSAAELRVANVATGASESVFPGQAVQDFDLSPDGNSVVFSTRAAQVWIAPLDRSAPPRQLATGADQPSFIGATEIVLRQLSGATNTLARLHDRPGTARSVRRADHREIRRVSGRQMGSGGGLSGPRAGRVRNRDVRDSTRWRGGPAALPVRPGLVLRRANLLRRVGNRLHWKDDVLAAGRGSVVPRRTPG